MGKKKKKEPLPIILLATAIINLIISVITLIKDIR